MTDASRGSLTGSPTPPDAPPDDSTIVEADVTVINTQEEEQALRKQRTLTEKGLEHFQTQCATYSENLIKQRTVIQNILTEFATTEIDNVKCEALKQQLTDLFNNYKSDHNKFYDFLERHRTPQSDEERGSIEIIRRTLAENVNTTIKEMDKQLNQNSYAKSEMSIKSGRSKMSTASSIAEKRAKAEAAKASLVFAKKQIQLKKQQLEIEAEYDLMEQEKEAAAAVAEYNAFKDEFYFEENVNEQRPTDITIKKEFISNLNPNSKTFIPRSPATTPELSTTKEVATFLMKKDLLSHRLTTFDDRPESFTVWRNTFRSVVAELSLRPDEELDLLVKWLGPESKKYAASCRSSSACNPSRGLHRLWERLFERYGCPEMIESTLKSKLEKFQRINNRDNKRLYDLSDLLSEVESCMEDPKYKTLLGYYNSSSGVSPIVAKLPTHIQSKWMSRATKFKQVHSVTFPPFSEFCQFVKEIGTMYNDPSFTFTPAPSRYPADSGTTTTKPVNVRKTEVKQYGADKTVCPIHKAPHSLNQCKAFKNKTMADRKKFLRENNICYKCCESNTHIFRDCTAAIQCSVCKSDRHPDALHSEQRQGEKRPPANSQGAAKNHGREETEAKSSPTEEKPVNGTVHNKCTNVCGSEFFGRSCAKIVLVKVYPDNQVQNAQRMYAILDDQSSHSLCRPEFFDAMQISSKEAENYTLVSCAGTYQTQGRTAKGFTVAAIDDSFTVSIPHVLECGEIPSTRSEIPTPEISQHHKHLEDIAIPELEPNSEILLLIGRDVPEAHHVFDQKTGPRNSPFAQKLGLGWVIIGDVCIGKAHRPDRVNVMKTKILEDGRPTIFPQCNYKFDVKRHEACTPSLEEDVFLTTAQDNKPGLSQEDKEFLNLMDTEFSKNKNGHWSAPLPFKNPRQRLPNNSQQALKRALVLDASLKRDAKKKQHFQEFMSTIFQNGHAEKAPPLEDEECWYLPIFGVYHPKKKDQIRAVFDSSAKHQGISLNNVLLTGPDLTNGLVGILMRFRQDTVAISGDIQQMFYQFQVHPEHRNYLRFFWYADNNMDNKLIEYRMCVHVFGNSPSPAVATYGLRKLAQLAADPDVENFIKRDFYVDDGLTCLPSADKAVSLMKRTQAALSTEGSLRLHKIASNDKKVLKAFPEEDLDKNLKCLDLNDASLPTQRSLGLSWDLDRDSFKFEVAKHDKPHTKRGVLSTVNSLYDPLGFIAPVTIGGKLLLREITAEVQDWDEPIPSNLEEKWKTWLQSLQGLADVTIPRPYVFSDASEQAIAAVAYMKVTGEDGQTYVSFVCGKSKVAPKHGHTIPRLELCAALLAVEVAELVSEELALPSQSIRFYTDSKVVLGYIQNKTRRFYIYVENRVNRILQFTSPDKWFYVATDKNPADQATRAVASVDLPNSSWLTGSTVKEILEEGDNQTFPLVSPEEDHEIRPMVQTLKTAVSSPPQLGTERFARFSEWKRLLIAVSLLIHLANTFKSKPNVNTTCKGWHKCQQYKTVHPHRQATNFVIRQYQEESFSKEIRCLEETKSVPKGSSIQSLSPFLDENGILRVGGRLVKADLPVSEKHPILIPRKSHLATLLVRHYHESVCHQGRHFTEGAVRAAGYWVIGAKRLINSMIHRCVKCQKLRGRPCQQKMSSLPADRLTPAPPFTFVGIDVFGPWSIVTRRTRGGTACAKRWAVLFACQTSRAVHIELIEEMSSSSFINALRRFFSIRGKVKEIRSDRGTNFVGATDDLKIDSINVEDNQVGQLLYNSGTVWQFNAPHSSHMSGSWERMIGVSRRVLESVLMDSKNLKLTHEVLSTLMAEVMTIVNSRPLVPVSTDPENPLILTPSILLTQKTESQSESFKHLDIKDAYRSQWKHVQYLSEQFWKRWRKEYVQTLQQRQKWTDKTHNLQEGDVVLLQDNSLARNDWPMGIITRVFPSNDNLVRKVELRVPASSQTTTYVRPITELVKLLGVEN